MPVPRRRRQRRRPPPGRLTRAPAPRGAGARHPGVHRRVRLPRRGPCLPDEGGPMRSCRGSTRAGTRSAPASPRASRPCAIAGGVPPRVRRVDGAARDGTDARPPGPQRRPAPPPPRSSSETSSASCSWWARSSCGVFARAGACSSVAEAGMTHYDGTAFRRQLVAFQTVGRSFGGDAHRRGPALARVAYAAAFPLARGRALETCTRPVPARGTVERHAGHVSRSRWALRRRLGRRRGARRAPRAAARRVGRMAERDEAGHVEQRDDRRRSIHRAWTRRSPRRTTM